MIYKTNKKNNTFFHTECKSKFNVFRTCNKPIAYDTNVTL